MHSPPATVHLLEREGGGGREGDRGGGEDEAGGRGRDVTTGVHGVEVLKAGEVEKEAKEAAERLVRHAEGGEGEGEQTLGVGGHARRHLAGEKNKRGVEGMEEGGNGGAGGSEEGEGGEEEVMEEEVEGGQDGPEDEAEEPTKAVQGDFHRVQHPGEERGNGSKWALAKGLTKLVLKGGKRGGRGGGG